MATTKAFISITTLAPKPFLNVPNVSIANAFRNIGNHFDAVAIGSVSESIILNTGAVAASGTFTVASGNLSADDTVTIGGVAFTAKASGATGNQFNIGASALITAKNCAASVNASANTKNMVVATAAAGGSSSGVVTFTCIIPGTIGNGISLAKSATNGSVSGTRLASGTDGTVTTLHKGI